MDNLRFRQIHLDFHTSELIDNVGSDFDMKAFAKTLKEASVDSITCFARCHHGMIYYDSKINPERVHPNLVNKNLLRQQVDACHEVGIKVPIYITVQWDYYSSVKHPEWALRDENGAPIGQHSLKAGFYHGLCVNTPYKDFLKKHTMEVIENLNPDGIFYDIVQEQPCACEYCIKSMVEKGYNPLIKEERLLHYKEVLNNFKQEMTDMILEYNDTLSVFYNAGHISYSTKSSANAFTHYELESLPGGEWGYIHFPVTSRYARNLGKEILGHTGKFHTSWGDFHSFRNKVALEYECFRMLAMNSRCLIGDQLEPNGKLSEAVYDLIGDVYGSVKKKQPWCENVKPITSIGVMITDEFAGSALDSLPGEQVGVTRLLEQLSYQFDFIDTSMDLNRFKLIILPDSIPVSNEFKIKLEDYIKNGGKILASFESGMDDKKENFNLDLLGVKVGNVSKDDLGCKIRGRYDLHNSFADYVLPEGNIKGELHQTEYVMYTKGVEINLEKGEVLSYSIKPYFHRSFKHFCSHRQAPSSGIKDYPAIVKNDSSIYFAHPIFKTYAKFAPTWIKVLLKNAIDMLIGASKVSHDGPSSVITSINGNEKHDVLHILWYIPEKKSEELEILEDVIPYHNLKISYKSERKVESVKMVPENINLDFAENNGVIEFEIPVFVGHAMIEIK